MERPCSLQRPTAHNAMDESSPPDSEPPCAQTFHRHPGNCIRVNVATGGYSFRTPSACAASAAQPDIGNATPSFCATNSFSQPLVRIEQFVPASIAGRWRLAGPCTSTSVRCSVATTFMSARRGSFLVGRATRYSTVDDAPLIRYRAGTRPADPTAPAAREVSPPASATRRTPRDCRVRYRHRLAARPHSIAMLFSPNGPAGRCMHAANLPPAGPGISCVRPRTRPSRFPGRCACVATAPRVFGGEPTQPILTPRARLRDACRGTTLVCRIRSPPNLPVGGESRVMKRVEALLLGGRLLVLTRRQP